MGKLLKQIRHGVYILTGSAQDLRKGTQHSRLYFKPTAPVKLPKSPADAMAADMKKIGKDMNTALKAHVREV